MKMGPRGSVSPRAGLWPRAARLSSDDCATGTHWGGLSAFAKSCLTGWLEGIQAPGDGALRFGDHQWLPNPADRGRPSCTRHMIQDLDRVLRGGVQLKACCLLVRRQDAVVRWPLWADLSALPRASAGGPDVRVPRSRTMSTVLTRPRAAARLLQSPNRSPAPKKRTGTPVPRSMTTEDA